ncbi:zinc ribbon domain-containing protein [Nocardioides sp. BP30]|uniref:zinc ribbon domain-containing protein n=1 Tax=Nocardioides sp. BP30 TaxID=3036374 RepID=UPI002468CDF3|nr:zinc ribbon domain-containing protein [Nocardioides sp. BP30]WGL53838.1 zinc ribbon domain-containing protein [Nocardioides sp. BP30]
MEFCGRCGTELGRGLDRGRFCPACGHEAPGNARYPLYADGTVAVTRRRPPSVSQLPDATVVARPARERLAARVPVAPLVEPQDRVLTRPRLPVVDPAPAPFFASARSATTPPAPSVRHARSGRVAVAVAATAALGAMLLVVLLGLFLLLR